MEDLTLFTAPTPNGWKVSIALEELALPYNVHYVHFSKNEQKSASFLKLNPNGRIPVLVDHHRNDFTISESGAILLYLTELTDQLWPVEKLLRHQAMQWLMFQMSAVGPMMGQAMYFQRIAAPKGINDQFAISRYIDESKRLLAIVNQHLRGNEFICGEFSMVDIAMFPWARAYPWANVDVADLTELQRWMTTIEARPAVQRGLSIPERNDAVFGTDDTATAGRINAQKYSA